MKIGENSSVNSPARMRERIKEVKKTVHVTRGENNKMDEKNESMISSAFEMLEAAGYDFPEDKKIEELEKQNQEYKCALMETFEDAIKYDAIIRRLKKQNEEFANLKVCIGCGHLSIDEIVYPALACCPDSSYIGLREYAKKSVIC